MDLIKDVIDKVASRKLAVTAAATGAAEITMPVAIVAAAISLVRAEKGGVPIPIRTDSPSASTSPPPMPPHCPS